MLAVASSQKAESLFFKLESNHFKIPEVQLLCTTDSPPLIFVQFSSNFLCMCTYCTANAEETRGKSDKY